MLSLAPHASGTEYMCASAAQHHIYEGAAYRRKQMLGIALLLMLQNFKTIQQFYHLLLIKRAFKIMEQLHFAVSVYLNIYV
jgi:hypothetical protein